MAARLRIPQRAQLARPRSCPFNNSLWPENHYFLSVRLQASTRAAAGPSSQPVRLKTPSRAPAPSAKPSSSSSSSSSSTSSSTAQTLDVLVQQRKWPLFGAGLVALGIGFYISTVIVSTIKHDHATSTTTPTTPSLPPGPIPSDPSLQPPPSGLPAALQQTSTPETTALAFDKSLNWPERLMGITSLRRELAARARGHVLEVAVGTGRNLAFYDWSEVVALSQDEAEARAQRERERLVRVLDQHRPGGPLLQQQQGDGVVEEGKVLSFTGVDVSGEMLGVSRDRIRESVPGLTRIMRKRRVEAMPGLASFGVDGVGEEGVPVVDALDGRVRLVLGDALRGLPSPPAVDATKEAVAEQGPATKYDTIIQTFGLCSVADPARLLANMAAKVQPDTGRIVLLEHGRGFYGWINKKLDEYAPAHFHKYGCWWNRDIEQLVREAARTVPGLEVVSLDRAGRFQFGTTLLIELRVNSQST